MARLHLTTWKLLIDDGGWKGPSSDSEECKASLSLSQYITVEVRRLEMEGAGGDRSTLSDQTTSCRVISLSWTRLVFPNFIFISI